MTGMIIPAVFIHIVGIQKAAACRRYAPWRIQPSVGCKPGDKRAIRIKNADKAISRPFHIVPGRPYLGIGHKQPGTDSLDIERTKVRWYSRIMEGHGHT